MKRIFLDSNIPMYWGGKPSKYLKACGSILKAVAREKVEGITNAEVLQEILYRFWHIRDMDRGRQVFVHFSCIITTVWPVTIEDGILGRELTDSYGIGPRDLVHVASMRNADITYIASADRDFDRIELVERIDPLEFEAWLRRD